MMDLLDQVELALKVGGYDAHQKRLDKFTGREGICIRRVGGQVTQSYFDGYTEETVIYQVICRSRSEETAMTQCMDIRDYLMRRSIVSANGSYDWIGQKVYTSPQELALEERGFFAWEVRLQAEIGSNNF